MTAFYIINFYLFLSFCCFYKNGIFKILSYIHFSFPFICSPWDVQLVASDFNRWDLVLQFSQLWSIIPLFPIFQIVLTLTLNYPITSSAKYWKVNVAFICPMSLTITLCLTLFSVILIMLSLHLLYLTNLISQRLWELGLDHSWWKLHFISFPSWLLFLSLNVWN